jgi:stage II sporulation protein D
MPEITAFCHSKQLLRTYSGEKSGLTARKLGWNTLPSDTFARSDAVGDVVLNGVGRGHGVGMCQRGAIGMALDGKDLRTILDHYFPNTTVESVQKP